MITYLAAVIAMSFQPLIVSKSALDYSPFIFFGTWLSTQGITLSFYHRYKTLRGGRRGIEIKQTLQDQLKKHKVLGAIAIVIVIAPQMNWFLFERATKYSTPTLATILFEIQATVLIILLTIFPASKLQNNSSVHQKIEKGKWALITLAFSGVVLVLFSQTDTFTIGTISKVLSSSSWGLAAGIMAAINALVLFRLPYWLGFEKYELDIRDNIGLYISSRQQCIAGLISLLLFFPTEFLFGSINFVNLMIPFLGGLTGAIGWALLQRANHALVSYPAVNSLYNLTPLLSLVWLGIFSDITILKLDWFILGALVIITSNTLLHLDPRPRRCFD